MSLKDLIRTLIESAFTSKKSFISAQAFPNATKRITIGLKASGSYTAPSDGFFGVYTDGSFEYLDIYLAKNEVRRISARISNGTNSGSNTIPVSKGETVNWSCNKVLNEIWFVKSLGS